VGGRIEISAYRSQRDSLIYFIQNSQRSFVAQNLQSAVAKGIELSAEVDLVRRLELRGAFTTQEVRHEGSVPHWENKWLPYVSPREYYGRIAWRAGRVTFRYEYEFFDAYYRDRANTEEDRAAARSYHGAGLRLEMNGPRMVIDFDVQNISDDKTSDVFAYPLPGRTYYVTVQFNRNES
jgi:outer membrane receptor protein involved in Fe transport